MDYSNPDVLRNALATQNLRIAKRCIRAGQNPMQWKGFCRWAAQGPEIKPEYISLLALHKIINLNEILISVDTRSFLFLVLACNYTVGPTLIRKLHLLLQSGYDVNGTLYHGSISSPFALLSKTKNMEAALMLLFANGNPKEKWIPNNAKPTVQKWLNGFRKAKELFRDIFDDADLESLLLSFIFNETYLCNALGM